MNIYAERRARALAALRGGVAVIPSAREIIRSNDSEYPFRQNSDFYYLTGFDEPDALLVLAPEHPDATSVLFLRERDRAMEIWNGKRLGVEPATQALGVDRALPIDTLDDRLPGLLVGAERLFFDLEAHPTFEPQVRAAMRAAKSKTRRAGRAPRAIADPTDILHAMRQIKDAHEIATMRRAGALTADAHALAMRATRPGAYEYEIAARIEYATKRAGAQHMAYQSIVAGGDNATILHYRENRDRLADGTLLLVDAACEIDYYAADVTRTWPVGGRFSPEQRAIYEIVLRAQEAAIAEVQPGRPQRAFHEAAVRTITEGLIELGLLRGSVDENIEQERYRDYYMHGTGHWLGLDVHDVGRTRDAEDQPIALAAGMVTTVEPGIYVHRDLNCDERFKGIGVRIEDDLLVTNDGHENLTAAAPKRIAEIEAIVGSEALTAVR
ncbi:MAG: aminopeptidase P N-terminal domain-containing protein [bacterium]|nr:aminopeptidase P N-terminal domain-containing protein [bacterium]